MRLWSCRTRSRWRPPIAAAAALAVLAALHSFGTADAAFSRTTAPAASTFTAASNFAAGALDVWGSGSSGQAGGSSNVLAPVQIGAVTTWTQLAEGQDHVCGVRTDTTLWCWGSNASGQLGLGNTTNFTTPQQVAGAWSAVSAGLSHTCGIKTTGSLWCWGDNGNGQLGLGTSGTGTGKTSPNQVGTATTWTAITVGGYHSCGIQTVTGVTTLYCWGWNGNGQLGIGGTTDKSTPQPVTAPAGHWSSVAAGYDHNCGINDSGALYCWGRNVEGQIGIGNNTTPQSSPALVAVPASKAGKTWTSVAGSWTTCGILSDKSLFCWGWNANGEIGNNSTTDTNSPVQVSGNLTTWTSVAVGYQHTCGVQVGRSVWCWGDNADGQLGLGDTTQRTVPTKISGGFLARPVPIGPTAYTTIAIN